MESRPRTIVFEGMAGKIDCALDWPEKGQDPIGWALVLHPNPAEGGTRDNKVITTISRACAQYGLLAVRPNFRGIGESEGEFDRGLGETQDMRLLVDQMQVRFPKITAGTWVLAGFSFGTSVGVQLYGLRAQGGERLPDDVIWAGSAALRFRHYDGPVPEDALIVHGEEDDVVPIEEVMRWSREHDLPVVVMPNAGHFFHGKLLILRNLVQQRLRALLFRS